MPTPVTVLKALVAFPHDLTEEWEVIRTAVDEINKTSAEALGLRLEFLYWKKDAYPAATQGIQAEINRQLGDQYDIFLGILWTRFGTKTEKYGSGTEEEFENALEKYRSNPSSVRIMMYFKHAMVDPERIDSEQLGKVKLFKERIKSENILYWDYKDAESLASLLRIHVTRQIQDYGKA
jgi:hypothetical protein